MFWVTESNLSFSPACAFLLYSVIWMSDVLGDREQFVFFACLCLLLYSVTWMSDVLDDSTQLIFYYFEAIFFFTCLCLFTVQCHFWMSDVLGDRESTHTQLWSSLSVEPYILLNKWPGTWKDCFFLCLMRRHCLRCGVDSSISMLWLQGGHSSVQFSSRWYQCTHGSLDVLLPISEKFHQCCLWNCSSNGLTDDAFSFPFNVHC